MPFDLDEILDPGRAAVLTMELQRGIAGDLATMPDLAAELRRTGVLDRAGAVCRAARTAGAVVVHCTAVTRPDRLGRLDNCRLLAATSSTAAATLEGTPGADVVPELEPSPDDLVMGRLHGLTPFTGTSLDRILRNAGVETVVAVGNSLNVGVLGLVLSAVDLGYQVVVVEDAVAGVPAEYGRAVLDNTIGLLATLVSTADVEAAWASD